MNSILLPHQVMDSSDLRLLGGVREHDRANVQYHAPARGNLVVLNPTSTSYSTEEQDAFLGDWEKEVAVARLWEEGVQINTKFRGRESINR